MTGPILSLLGNIKTYIDGKFRIIMIPFKQLFGIHGFIKHGDCIINYYCDYYYDCIIVLLITLKEITIDLEYHWYSKSMEITTDLSL